MVRNGFALFMMLAAAAALPESSAAQDALLIGAATGARGAVVEVPIYVKDAEGTPLGEEYVFGQNIQGFAFQIQYEPAEAVASIRAVRSGLTQELSAPYETRRATGNTVSYLMASSEGAQRISGLTGAGGEVARLIVQIAETADANSTIDLRFTPAKTMLSNTAGTILETTANGGLALANGSIAVTGDPAVTSVSLSVSKAKAAEKGRKMAVITLVRTGSLTAPLQVGLRIKGTAKNGVDYVKLPAKVTFKRKQAKVVLKIKPIDDRLKEKQETVLISLKPSARYEAASHAAAVISIADNDRTPR